MKYLLDDILDIFHGGPGANRDGSLPFLAIADVSNKDLEVGTPVRVPHIEGIVHADGWHRA